MWRRDHGLWVRPSQPRTGGRLACEATLGSWGCCRAFAGLPEVLASSATVPHVDMRIGIAPAMSVVGNIGPESCR